MLYQQLFFEGVKEELGQSSELLYVSVENQALSHLPYIIALDHTSRRDLPLHLQDIRLCMKTCLINCLSLSSLLLNQWSYMLLLLR